MEALWMEKQKQQNSRIVGVVTEEESFVKLPMGYRFLPTDFQLISCYLIPKVMRRDLPADVISSVDVLDTNPWDLPGDSREKRYFFCKRGRKENRCKLLNGSGYWKATRKEQLISDNSGKLIGLKRKLIFCHQKRKSTPTGSTATHDRWVMWEYRLVACTNKNAIEEVGDWMVCALISEKNNPINNNNGRRRSRPCRNAIEMENYGDGDVFDHDDHFLVTKTPPCHKMYLFNNINNNKIVATLMTYETTLSPQESSTSSSSTMTLVTDEDLFSREEAISHCLD